MRIMPDIESLISFSQYWLILPKPNAFIVRFWLSGRPMMLLTCVIRTVAMIGSIVSLDLLSDTACRVSTMVTLLPVENFFYRYAALESYLMGSTHFQQSVDGGLYHVMGVR